MAEVRFWSFIVQEFKHGYKLAFETTWPVWLVGVLLAILSLLIFLWWYTWGIIGGIGNWGDWIYYLLGIYDSAPEKTIFENGMSVSNLGLVAGAMASAMFSKQFRINFAPKLEYVKGLTGGVLMGSGAALAAGCNVGGFYCALGMFDLSGVVMMLGLAAGAYLGLLYLLWEMENLPSASDSGRNSSSRRSWEPVKPYLGLVLFILIILIFLLSSQAGSTQTGGLLFFGFLIGLIMHRGRFCFANAFREPFMTGDGKMMRGVLISLMVYVMGSAVIKWGYIQPPEAGVYHAFWLGSLIGGLVFGFGMILAGGCGSGTLWRVGEGHVKLWMAMAGMIISYSPSLAFLKNYDLTKWLSYHGVFMPNIFSWPISLSLFYLFCPFLILILFWNEKTEKFVLF